MTLSARRPSRHSLVTTVMVLALGCSAPRESGLLVVEHVTVIDGSGGPVLSDQSIVIRGSRIVEIGPTNQVQAGGANRVDASGAFAIPGLWDMHAHLSAAGRQSLAQYVAHGVTGVRDLGGDLETVRGWENEVAAGSIVGPQILAAGTII